MSLINLQINTKGWSGMPEQSHCPLLLFLEVNCINMNTGHLGDWLNTRYKHWLRPVNNRTTDKPINVFLFSPLGTGEVAYTWPTVSAYLGGNKCDHSSFVTCTGMTQTPPPPPELLVCSVHRSPTEIRLSLNMTFKRLVSYC